MDGIAPWHSVQRDEACDLALASDRPLRPIICQEILDRHKITRKLGQTQFDVKMQPVASGDSESAKAIPKKVEYARVCCEFCSSNESAENQQLLRMRNRFVNMMASFVCAACKRPLCDVLVACAFNIDQ